VHKKGLVIGALTAASFASAGVVSSAFAQCDLSGSPNTTLRTPLIQGAPATPPMQEAPEGQPPPIGDGSQPAPVVAGHTGAPTLLPFVPIYPANHINYPSYRAPFNPSAEDAPGQYGPSTWVPPAPSTPGADPGMISGPPAFYPPPVNVVHINPGGGIYGSAPTQRWGGQTTRDFGRYKYQGKRAYDWGRQLYEGSTSYDGPWPAHQGSVDQDLYGRRQPYTNGYGSIQTIAPH
jgi:hypothetical protein